MNLDYAIWQKDKERTNIDMMDLRAKNTQQNDYINQLLEKEKKCNKEHGNMVKKLEDELNDTRRDGSKDRQKLFARINEHNELKEYAYGLEKQIDELNNLMESNKQKYEKEIDDKVTTISALHTKLENTEKELEQRTESFDLAKK